MSFAFAVLLSVTLLFSSTPAFQTATAQEAPNHLWDGQLSFEDRGSIPEALTTIDPNCELQTVLERVVRGPTGSNLSIVELLNSFDTIQIQANQCVYRNAQGNFNNPDISSKKLYAPAGGLTNYMELDTGSEVPSPAPSGPHVLLKNWRFPSSATYRLAYAPNFRDDTSLGRQLNIQVIHRFNGLSTARIPFTYSNGNEYEVTIHAFSPNGRYVVAQAGVWLHKIDLDTLEMTPVKYVPGNSNRSISLSISSNGRYIAHQTSNSLSVVDSEGCESTYAFGSWQNHGFAENPPGCVVSGNLLEYAHSNGIIDIYSGNANRQYRRAYFDLVGDTLTFAFGEKFSGQPDYTWREIAITAEDYVSTAQGYLAMGDSFVSGEGDLQGGEWYEPGTDEQGDKETFAGRNLCHLSRRSYPYLMAVDLGYLSSPSTPPADGLFHSVACSGAKIHNIIGGTGIFEGDGDATAFQDTDNQFRPIDGTTLGVFQPGYRSQIDLMQVNNLQPEAISISIGGNDADFGGFIMSCLGPRPDSLTCDQASEGSIGNDYLGVRMAQQKHRLVESFKKVKTSAPEARVYVHGYPQFLNPEIEGVETCNFNVQLNLQERIAASQGVSYMNDIIEAAALEAGVFYVDVEDILIGGRLCDTRDNDELLFNGITGGNDIDPGILGVGLCSWRAGCAGNETYHPRPAGHEKYAERIQLATNDLTAAMPEPQPQNIPLPPEGVFGELTRAYVNAENSQFGSSVLVVPQAGSLLSLGASTGQRFVFILDNMLAGSEAESWIESTPTDLGTYTVDENGVLRFEVDVPESIEPGTHTVFITGTDKFGQEVTIYEPIMIASSDIDFDGDGVPNEEDSCSTIQNSGTDEDQDGVDDSCDDEVIPVVNPPEPPEPEPQICKVLRKLETALPRFLRPLVQKLYDKFDCPVVDKQPRTTHRRGWRFRL